MLDAVLFDWGNTLVRLAWDEALVAAGHRAGLGRDDAGFSERWRRLVVGGEHGHRPYAELLAELGVEDPDGFVEREHEVWRPAYRVLAGAPALLASLRECGLKTGLVANSWPDPPEILRADAEALGLAPLLDVLVYAGEVGARKPAAEPFLRACEELRVEPAAALFVGDGLVPDVQGATAVGMRTVQAMWFRADDNREIEPDYRASGVLDVLEAARGLLA